MLEHNEFFDWVIKAVLAASFGGWAWVVKTFGERHIVSVHELTEKLDNVTKQLVEMNLRLSILEHDYKEFKERAGE